LLAAALLLCGQAAYSQSASDAARNLLDAMKRKDYAAASAMYSPQALAEFRGMMGFLSEFPEEVEAGLYGGLFGPEVTPETIAKMSDTEYFAGFLTAVFSNIEDRIQAGIEFGDLQVLGEVAEGPNVAHVVTRTRAKVGEIEVEAMEVVSFTKASGAWQALMSGEIKGIPQQLRATLSQQ
jgi:hypothetical protein